MEDIPSGLGDRGRYVASRGLNQMAMTLAQCIDTCRNQFPFQPHAVNAGQSLAQLLVAADFLRESELKYSISHTTVSISSTDDSGAHGRWITLFANDDEIRLTLLQDTESKPVAIRDASHSQPVDAVRDVLDFVASLDSIA